MTNLFEDEKAKIEAIDAKIAALEALGAEQIQTTLDHGSRIAALEEAIKSLLTPAPAPLIWPYGNWENCKYTFPDASEVPALDIRNTGFDSKFIKFNPDGSIRFSLPEGIDFTPTKTAKNPRMERREYKDMKAKTNFKKGDIIIRDFYVIFHKLNLGASDVVWSQMHGEDPNSTGDEPYWKIVAGKNGVRIQCKTIENLPEDNKVLPVLPHSELELEKPYRYRSVFDGSVFEGRFHETDFNVVFNRTDEYYAKEGAYGPLGAVLSHLPS